MDFYTDVFLLMSDIAVGKDYVELCINYYEDTGGQYCFIKVVIKQVGDEVIKEETLDINDGRKKFDGPTYWELFADFYYAGIDKFIGKYDRGNMRLSRLVRFSSN